MSYKPYEGGEDALWALNELCRARSTASSFRWPQVPLSPFMRSKQLVAASRFKIYEGNIEGSEDEIVIARAEIGLNYKYNARLIFGIAFGHVKGVKGKTLRFPSYSCGMPLAQLSMRLSIRVGNLG